VGPRAHRRGNRHRTSCARADQLGEYQAQAAIAALHADAPRVEETDWVQIVEWYERTTPVRRHSIVRLNRAVAVGEADGAPAGTGSTAEVDEHVPRREAVAAYLHEKNAISNSLPAFMATQLATHQLAERAIRRAKPRDSTSTLQHHR